MHEGCGDSPVHFLHPLSWVCVFAWRYLQQASALADSSLLVSLTPSLPGVKWVPQVLEALEFFDENLGAFTFFIAEALWAFFWLKLALIHLGSKSSFPLVLPVPCMESDICVQYFYSFCRYRCHSTHSESREQLAWVRSLLVPEFPGSSLGQ